MAGLAALALLMALTACNRRPLEVFYPETVSVRLCVAWYEGSPYDEYLKAEGKPLSNFGTSRSDLPNGMTVLLAKNGEKVTQTNITNDVEEYNLSLAPGTYYMMLFNNTTSEYSNMLFQNMSDFVKAQATVGTTTRSTRVWDDSVSYLNTAEKIGVAVDTLVITEEMLKSQLSFTSYENRNDLPAVPEEKIFKYYESVQLMTTTLTVRVKVRGIENMQSVVGNIDGMAEGFYLSQVWRTENSGTQYLSGWKVEYDDKGNAYIVISVPTMGLPHGKEFESQRDSTDNVLKLHFTLKDGTTIDYTYNVGKYIHYTDDNGGDIEGTVLKPADVTLELLLELDAPLVPEETLPELPDVTPVTPDDPGTKTGGFDAEVAPWEDGGTVDIGL